jgi:glycosyltransferase involved in cell wall biosynthesis
MGLPLVMGPLGGGEAAPLRLFAGLPFKAKAFDYLRSLSLVWVRMDPLATWGPRRAALVLCRSKDSLRALPRSVQPRAVVVPEIGSPDVDLSHRRQAEGVEHAPAQRRWRLLFAGRLLGWKGVAMALAATALLLQDKVDVQLDIAGDGPLRPHLEAEIERLGLQDRVRLLGVLARPELMAYYGQADLFVFPSLHDSGGSVVLEALSRGLPVVCLDLGGPQNYVDAHSGIVVSTATRSRADIERALADAIGQVLRDPGRLAAMSQGAAAHARRQTWEATVRQSYAVIDARLADARG